MKVLGYNDGEGKEGRLEIGSKKQEKTQKGIREEIIVSGEEHKKEGDSRKENFIYHERWGPPEGPGPLVDFMKTLKKKEGRELPQKKMGPQNYRHYPYQEIKKKMG